MEEHRKGDTEEERIHFYSVEIRMTVMILHKVTHIYLEMEEQICE